ncbi:MAG: hypothetical protein JWP27_1103 [Flaviaesturariibacter sp.]|nr:hypothetical protein [Flaviaesturariibacter sp.]
MQGLLLFLCPVVFVASSHIIDYLADMNLSRLACAACIVLFAACSGNQQETVTSDSDVDAARNFIRASLDNNFEQAAGYMIPDSTNTEYLDAVKRNRGQLTKDENFSYRESSIRIYDTRRVNDSTSIVSYSNSFKNQKDSVMVVRRRNQWLVDLKFSFAKR